MTDKPMVSIIVPIYNVKGYLDKCLDSLKKQTYKDIEVIMVDDVSTDGSADIAKEYEKKDARFHFVERPVNEGLSVARNCGLDRASGEYCLFVDSDDYLATNTIGELYEIAKRCKLDLIKFGGYCFWDGSNEYDRNVYCYKGVYGTEPCEGRHLLGLQFQNDDDLVSACMMLIRARFLKSNHVRFKEGIIHEDILFHYHVLMRAKRVSILNEPLYYRRIREGSITQLRDYEKACRSLTVVLEEIAQIIESDAEATMEKEGRWTKHYADTAVFNYCKMSMASKNSISGKDIYRRLSNVIRKYNGYHTFALKTFAIHPLLMEMYIALRERTRKSKERDV